MSLATCLGGGGLSLTQFLSYHTPLNTYQSLPSLSSFIPSYPNTSFFGLLIISPFLDDLLYNTHQRTFFFFLFGHIIYWTFL